MHFFLFRLFIFFLKIVPLKKKSFIVIHKMVDMIIDSEMAKNSSPTKWVVGELMGSRSIAFQ